MIDQTTKTVYIPLGGGAAACQPRLDGTAGKAAYREAGQYSVNVYAQHYQALLDAGDIQPLTEDSAVLINLSLYDSQMGLSLKADPGKAEFI